ncbi:unnamed protein product, partial [Mesorhabditis belari]|uniref:Uncharacterized protein n=1 Tax=Mesorhabditis belari TaxID=2138241 RepID=A0AAF3EJZ0_9BILA
MAIATSYMAAYTSCWLENAVLVGLVDFVNETMVTEMAKIADASGNPGSLYYINMRGNKAQKSFKESDLYDYSLFKPLMDDPPEPIIQQYNMLDTEQSGIVTICKRMAYCQPPRCPLQEFNLFVDPAMIEYPTEAMTLAPPPPVDRGEDEVMNYTKWHDSCDENASKDYCNLGKCVDGEKGARCDCMRLWIGGEFCEYNFTKRALLPTGDECIQSVSQNFVVSVTAIWSGFQLVFDHPPIFAVNLVACRLSHWFLALCSQFVAWNWLVQSWNAYMVVSGRSINQYNEDIDGKRRWWLGPFTLSLFPFYVFLWFNSFVALYGYNQMGSLWTCSARFTADTYLIWGPELAMQVALFGFAWGFNMAAQFRRAQTPHGWICTLKWFEVNRPLEIEKALRVHRNQVFMWLGPPLQLAYWIAANMASNRNTCTLTWTAAALGSVYGAVIFVQGLITHSPTYKYVVKYVMIYAPKWMSPRFDPTTLRNRFERLAKNNKARLHKELMQEKEKKEKEKKKEIEEIIRKNEKMKKKFGELPAQLVYHVPTNGPDTAISPWKFHPSIKQYISEYKRRVLIKQMCLEYWIQRAISRLSKKQSMTRLVNNCKANKLFEGKSQRDQTWALLAIVQKQLIDLDHFEIPDDSIPDKLLLTNATAHPADQFESMILNITKWISSDAWKKANARYQKYHDGVAPLIAVMKWLKYIPPNTPDHASHISVEKDASGERGWRQFERPPEIVLESQLPEQFEFLEEELVMRNERYDKIYTDDPMFAQWIGTPYEEAAREIMKPVEAFILDEQGQPGMTINPREKPIENWFLNDARPGFIGPRERSPVELGPLTDHIRATCYFQTCLDAGWRPIARTHLNQRERLLMGPHPLDGYVLGNRVDAFEDDPIELQSGNPYNGPY